MFFSNQYPRLLKFPPQEKQSIFREKSLEIFILILFWLVSIAVSIKIFNRPLGPHHEWLTGSTLAGLRSFEDYGFFPLAGQLNRLPNSFEFYGIDPKVLPGWKPHHPSLFLIAPYSLYKILNFLGIDFSITPAFIQIYQLVFTRLLSIIFVYFIIKNILNYIKLDSLNNKLLAFIGTFFWLFNPPVLYWTQNVYHEDQAHLTPSLVLIYLTLVYGFNFQVRTKIEAVFHIIISFWLCSSSYYGGMLIPAIYLWCVIKNFVTTSPFGILVCLKQQFLKLKFLFAGMMLSILAYFCQLSYIGYIQRPFQRFSARTGEVIVKEEAVSLKKIYLRIWEYIVHYLPLNISEVRTFSGLIIIVLISIVLCYFVAKISDKKIDFIAAIGLITLTPIAYVVLLKNYSYIHNFSVLKISLPLIVLTVVLPLVILNYNFNYLSNIFARPEFMYLAFIFLLTFSFIFIFQSTYPEFLKFAGKTDKSAQDFGIIIVNNIAKNELPISENLSVNIDFRPYRQFYTKRLVYKPNQRYITEPSQHERFPITFKKLMEWGQKGQANLNNILSMKPVYLEYTDRVNSSPFNEICKGYWNPLEEKVQERGVSICRSPLLKEVFLKNKSLNEVGD